MLFQRRQRLSLPRRLRRFLWPETGWHRAVRYMGHRIVRIPDSPHAIAAGLASGAAVSFTPFLGFHFLLAALLAWATRGNYVASAVGTAVGNPWTFPFIWLWIYQTGIRLLAYDHRFVSHRELTLRLLFDQPSELFLPMMVGGIASGIVAWFVVYYVSRLLFDAYRDQRRRRMARRMDDGGSDRAREV